MEPSQNSKRCSKCHVVKSTSAFYKGGPGRHGFRPECKQCHLLADKKHRIKNHKHRLAYEASYRKANQPKRQQDGRGYARYQMTALTDGYLKRRIRERNLKLTVEQLRRRIQIARTRRFFLLMGATAQLKNIK